MNDVQSSTAVEHARIGRYWSDMAELVRSFELSRAQQDVRGFPVASSTSPEILRAAAEVLAAGLALNFESALTVGTHAATAAPRAQQAQAAPQAQISSSAHRVGGFRTLHLAGAR